MTPILASPRALLPTASTASVQRSSVTPPPGTMLSSIAALTKSVTVLNCFFGFGEIP